MQVYRLRDRGPARKPGGEGWGVAHRPGPGGALAELVEARALLDMDHTCCVCEDVAATALCLHCRDMMCTSCTKAHRKMTMSKHHTVEELSSLTPDLLADSRQPACSSHPDEACSLFCPTHDLSFCVLCATAKHRSCPGLQDLEQKTEEARAALVQMAASLTATESELEEAIQRLDRHIKDTDIRVQAAISRIQETCDQLEACVRSCRSNMKELARSAGSDIKEKAQAAITILQAKKSRITSHSVVVTRAGWSKADATVREMSAVMGMRVQQLDCDVTLPASNALTPMVFLINGGVVSTVEEALTKLCRVQKATPNRSVSATRSEAGDRRSRGKSANRGGVGADQKNEGVAGKGIPPLLSLQDLTAQLTPGVKVEWKCPAVEFTFHEKHGAMIVLSDDRKTATRQEGTSGGLVASRDRIKTNVLYEVQLDQWRKGQWFAVGVLTVSPNSVTGLRVSGHLPQATAVSTKGVKVNGAMYYVDHPLSSVLGGLRQGERVGVSVDTFQNLHLHVNGEDLGVCAAAVTGPWHALLELGNISRVTALPPTQLE